jgi:uncharacterized repeat protein (TIGR04076 family)
MAEQKENQPESRSEKQEGGPIRERYLCRITVLRKLFHEDLFRQYPYGMGEPCGRFEEGQVFLSESRWDPPAGFCTWAWSDLRPVIQSIHSGHPTPFISCCTDGLRPVFFKLERVEK